MQKPVENKQLNFTLTVPFQEDFTTIDTIVASVLDQIKTLNKAKIEKRLRSILFLASSVNILTIVLQAPENRPEELKIIDFEFYDNNQVQPYIQVHGAIFFNLLLEHPQVIELLSLQLLSPVELLSCMEDQAKQQKLFLIDNPVCMAAFTMRRINFSQLCNCNPMLEANLQANVCYTLVEKKILTLDKVLSLTPLQRAFLNHPVIVALILDNKLEVDDYKYVTEAEINQLSNYIPRSIDNFIAIIKDKKNEVSERDFVVRAGFQP